MSFPGALRVLSTRGLACGTHQRPKPPPATPVLPDTTPKDVQAYAALGAGEDIVPFAYQLPSTEPPEGYVDLDVSHCGICHSDIHQIDDSWGVACFPLVPGHEIVGTISAVGGDAETRAKFKLGDRAAIGVQRGNCGCCAQCDAGLENTCPSISKTYAGPGKDKGGFADTIRYPASWVFSAPQDLPAEYVGPLMCAGITTFSPLKRLAKKGDRVGIVGIGGLGHLALQFARAMGCEVVAISRTPAKEAEARGFGASGFLVTEQPEAMAKAAASFDMILNTVSGHPALDAYFGLLKPRGVLACVGLPSKEEKSQVYLQSAVLTERSLVGSYLGPYDDYEDMLSFVAEHGITPQVEVYPVSKVNDAIRKVRENKGRYRVVLDMSATG